jgi:hypothetical protein
VCIFRRIIKYFSITPTHTMLACYRNLSGINFVSAFFNFIHTRVYRKVSGLAAWNENCKWYTSLPLGTVVSLFSDFHRHDPLCCFSTSVYYCLFRYRLGPETFGYAILSLDALSAVNKMNFKGLKRNFPYSFWWIPDTEGKWFIQLSCFESSHTIKNRSVVCRMVWLYHVIRISTLS